MEDPLAKEGTRMIAAFGRAFDALCRAQEGFRVDEFYRIGKIDYVTAQLDKCVQAIAALTNGMNSRGNWTRQEAEYQRSLLDGQQGDIAF